MAEVDPLEDQLPLPALAQQVTITTTVQVLAIPTTNNNSNSNSNHPTAAIPACTVRPRAAATVPPTQRAWVARAKAARNPDY